MADCSHTPPIVWAEGRPDSPRRPGPFSPAAFDLDAAWALVALVFLAPLMVGVALLILAEGDGPVLFRQTRVGLGGARFTVFKFRTMRADGDAVLAQHLHSDQDAAEEWRATHKLKNDPRVGRLGAFLRRSSLDELPQVLNVLRGEMSLVGPRPIVEAEIPRYGHRFASYCRVKPGITGLWQVSGRNDTTYRRRVAIDSLYAQRRSVLLNLRIVALTIPAVLSRRGSY